MPRDTLGGLAHLANDDLQSEFAAIVARNARIEGGCRLAPRLANFIRFERALHDIGDGSVFTARQATRQIASLRYAPRAAVRPC